MEIGAGADTWVVVLAGIVQTAYYTALVVFAGARILSRIAVMEFKVNELWQRGAPPAEGK